jgi:site-specific DNA-methyltransferase (adenine-specific)
MTYTDGDITLHHGDCLEIMPRLDWGEIDCIVTDPAYWTLNKWREMGTTTRLGGHRDADKREGWFDTITAEDLWGCLTTFGLLLPKNGHAWVMCDFETLGYIYAFWHDHQRTGQDAGEKPLFTYMKPYPVIKRTADGQGYRQGMGYHGRATHEYVVLLEKGRRRFADENWPDVFQIPWTGDAETRALTDDGKPFPTAKPLSLFSRLIELSTAEGDTVLDPFMGSGVAAEACIRLRRHFIGIEKHEAKFAVAKRRVQQARGHLHTSPQQLAMFREG